MIRLYQPGDTEEIVEAWYRASLLAHPFLTEGFLAQEALNLRHKFLPRSQTWVFEYEPERRVVGFISLLNQEVGGLFVHPAYQRQGIGRALMDKAFTLHDNLELDVFEANWLGRAFYASYGFVPRQTFRNEESGEMMIRLQCQKDSRLA